MVLNKEFYMVPEDVFRVGNAATPRLHMVKSSEVDITELNGVKVIIANGRGVSLYTKSELEKYIPNRVDLEIFRPYAPAARPKAGQR